MLRFGNGLRKMETGVNHLVFCNSVVDGWQCLGEGGELGAKISVGGGGWHFCLELSFDWKR